MNAAELESFGKEQGYTATELPNNFSPEAPVNDIIIAHDGEATPAAEAQAANPATDAPATPEVNTPSWEDLVKEKTGGKSWEEYTAHVAALEERSAAKRLEDDFEAAEIEKLKGLLSGGLTMDKLKKIVDIQSIDVDKLSSSEALARKLALVDGLSPEEIKWELHQYESGYSPEEIEDLSPSERMKVDSFKARLERESRNAKAELVKLKAENNLPQYKNVNNEEQLKQQEIQQQQQIAQWKTAVNESLSNYNEEVFALDKDNNFKYVVDEQSKQNAKAAMEDIVGFHKRYLGEDNKVQWDKLRREQFILNNWQSLVSAISKQAASQAKESLITKGINNVDFSNKQTEAQGGGENKSYAQQLADLGKNW